ncbi:hypothetical protein A0K93_09555 [Corynebacterium sp. BCW_4722]|nr:hypothetical protein A0K93_09555 [Corynebacterium sp. BCW_4722]
MLGTVGVLKCFLRNSGLVKDPNHDNAPDTPDGKVKSTGVLQMRARMIAPLILSLISPAG